MGVRQLASEDSESSEIERKSIERGRERQTDRQRETDTHLVLELLERAQKLI